MAIRESGLIVPIPEAESAVGRWRDRLDLSAASGVPAHVTVLYPFMPPESIDEAVERDLTTMFSGAAPFGFRLAHIGWFGRDVVYAVPTPDQPFRDLTTQVEAAWPDYPPYGGEHAEPTPHLTIGDQGSIADREEAGAEVAELLPIECLAQEVWLMSGTVQEGWVRDARFPLGSAS